MGERKKYMDDDLQSALRNRGHSSARIDQMTPHERFDEYCNWHGLIGWGPTLRRVLASADGVRQPNDEENPD